MVREKRQRTRKTAIRNTLIKSAPFRAILYKPPPQTVVIDFDNGYILVTAKGEEHTKNYLNREIPMTDQLMGCLKKYDRKCDRVFINQHGERYTDGIKKSLNSLIKKLKISRFTMHDLRHTFASHLVMEGVDLPTVQRLMGHANISTTMIYAHLAPDYLKSAINRLSLRFGKWSQNGRNATKKPIL